MAWPQWKARSLRRLALREKANLKGVSRRIRARRLVSRGLWNVTHHRFWALLLGAVSFGVVFIPVGAALRPLSRPEDARAILEILWQVQAAALALALAVVIFILEAVYSTNPRPSLRGLAEGIALPGIFYSGIFGVGLTGLVLMGAGDGAPGGWAATWAVVWSALSAGGLIGLFVAMLAQIEPDALYERWLKMLERQVGNVVENQIFERVAAAVLRNVCQEIGFAFQPVFGSGRAPHLTAVGAKRSGVVHDINLWRVRKAGRLASKAEPVPANRPETPAVLTHIGASVGEGNPLIIVPASVADGVGLADAFEIKARDPEAEFNATLTQVHTAALYAIRDANPGAYARMTDVYERFLLILPETWARYGQPFGPAIAGGLHPFELTVLDRVGRNLYDELEAAVLRSSREVGQDALNLPIAVAIGATRLRAIALSGRMLDLFVAVEARLIRSPASEDRRSLLGYSWLRLSEYGRFYLEPLVTEGDSSPEDRGYGAQALRQVFDAFAMLGKAVIDARPRDTDALAEINRHLDEFLQFWTPEHDRPQQWEVDLAAQRSEVDAATLADLKARAAENEARARIKVELTDWRAAQRFGLLFWALHRLLGTGDEAYVQAWNAFIGYFGNLNEAARTADRTIQADFEDHGPWSKWVMMELPTGQVHMPAVDNKLIQTFIVLALNRISPDGPAPEFGPLEWLSSRATDIRGLVEGVVADDAFRPLLPADRLEERAERVIESFEAMRRARDELEDQRVIDAPLDSEAVQKFRQRVRDAWASHRFVGPAMRAAGTYEALDGEPEEGSKFGLRQWIHKSMFIAEPGVLGADWTAGDLGRSLAAGEINALVELALTSEEFIGTEGGSLAERLRSAIAEVAQHGEQLALVPINWQLQGALEVRPSTRRGGDVQPPDWVPEEQVQASFIGTVDGTPVFEVPDVPDDRLVVIALDGFARWRQWQLDDGHEVAVELTAYGEEEAEALVEEHADLFRSPERTTVEARARELQTMALLDIYERFKTEVMDTGAARWLTVPDDLSRG